MYTIGIDDGSYKTSKWYDMHDDARDFGLWNAVPLFM
jgi:hypothetical protein